MLEIAAPLSLSRRLGRNFGNGYESEGILSDFCSRCFVKLDTVTGSAGLIRKVYVRLINRTIVFKTTFNCSHARIKNAINQILPDLDCTVCYKSTVTLANLCQ